MCLVDTDVTDPTVCIQSLSGQKSIKGSQQVRTPRSPCRIQHMPNQYAWLLHAMGPAQHSTARLSVAPMHHGYMCWAQKHQQHPNTQASQHLSSTVTPPPSILAYSSTACSQTASIPTQKHSQPAHTQQHTSITTATTRPRAAQGRCKEGDPAAMLQCGLFEAWAARDGFTTGPVISC